MIQEITINVDTCANGALLRWWENGWHYADFIHPITVTANSTAKDTRYITADRYGAETAPTSKDTEFSYTLYAKGLADDQILALQGLILSNEVQQYDLSTDTWYDVTVKKNGQETKKGGAPAGEMSITVTREDLPDEAGAGEIEQQFYVDDVLCELEEGSIVAVTKQCNTINDLQDRRADYSQSFRIKKTPAMTTLFEMAGEKGSNNRFPYIKHPCRYLAGGVEIFGDAVLNLVSVSDDWYTVSVYAGNAGLFSLLEESKLADLELDTCVHDWTLGQMKDTHDTDLDYCYPLVEPSDDGGIVPQYMNSTSCGLYAGYIWPFVKIRAIWNKIFADAGYTYGGKLFEPVNNPNLIANGYRMASGTDYPYDNQQNIVYLTAGQTYTLSARGKKDATATKLLVDIWENTWTSVADIFIEDTSYATGSVLFTPTITGWYNVSSYSWPAGNGGTCWTEWVMLQKGVVSVDENTVYQDNLTLFDRLHLPITNRNAAGLNVSPYLYAGTMYNANSIDYRYTSHYIRPNKGTVDIQLGDDNFRQNFLYKAKVRGTHSFKIVMTCRLPLATYNEVPPDNVYYILNGTLSSPISRTTTYQTTVNGFQAAKYEFNMDIDLDVRDEVEYFTLACYIYQVEIICASVSSVEIAYATLDLALGNYLPDMTQKDFVKTICNMYALIPQTFRGNYVYFWTYDELLANKVRARDWSAYLSVIDHETTFTLSGYSRKNNFKYAEIEDVTKDVSNGIIEVNDANLDKEADKVELDLSSTDEVYLMDNIPTSRIAFAKLSSGDASPVAYEEQTEIDPRIVIIDRQEAAEEKTVTLFSTVNLSGSNIVITNPKIARGIPLYFKSLLSDNYGGLQKILDGAIVRRLKFDLPALEVAELKHYIPVYLSQYGEYYLVNKISNYVEGRLCEVELIKI